jgi:hypothetical protein
MVDQNEEKDMLPDAEDADLAEPSNTPEDKEKKLVTLWDGRFKKSEEFRRPYIQKYLRMYKLYRAYRDATNYAYGTNLMPPTGFEIIETVKPRLSSAEVKVKIYPKKQEDLEKKDNIARWDDLIEYDLQVTEFDDLKIQWINAMLLYGNGWIQLMWQGGEDGDPVIEVVDNFLFYPDPQAMNRLKGARWAIKQLPTKNKAILKKEEEARGDDPLYTVLERDEETGEYKRVPLIKSKKWKELDESAGKSYDDPRLERYEINTLKMGQINDGRVRGQDDDGGPGDGTTDKNNGERGLEIWECFDYVEKKLQVIVNREHVIRDEENPYLPVLKGRTFIDLPDISLNWELYAMGHLEPVETTIQEIADSRNQAMDDIVFSLDPIRKVKKGAGYKAEDLKHEPGAIWYLQKADDVTFEKLPEVSRAWVEKDNLLRREVESSLALSEYVRGMPKSDTEPMGKVELLLMQTNIRFSLLVRQLEISMTQLVNGLIEMNQAYLGEQKSFRILGKNFRFGEFTSEDKAVIVDARVDIKPKRDKSPEQESKEAFELYKLFIVDDKPDPQDKIAVMRWTKKKNALQKMIVESMGYEDYVEVLVPDDAIVETPEKKEQDPRGGIAPALPAGPRNEGIADNPVPQVLRQPIPGPEAMIPLEQTIIPEGADAAQAEPTQGFLQRLLARAKEGRLV